MINRTWNETLRVEQRFYLFTQKKIEDFYSRNWPQQETMTALAYPISEQD